MLMLMFVILFLNHNLAFIQSSFIFFSKEASYFSFSHGLLFGSLLHEPNHRRITFRVKVLFSLFSNFFDYFLKVHCRM